MSEPKAQADGRDKVQGPSLSGRKSQTAGSLRGKLWPQQQAAKQLCKPVQAEEAVQLDPLES